MVGRIPGEIETSLKSSRSGEQELGRRAYLSTIVIDGLADCDGRLCNVLSETVVFDGDIVRCDVPNERMATTVISHPRHLGDRMLFGRST